MYTKLFAATLAATAFTSGAAAAEAANTAAASFDCDDLGTYALVVDARSGKEYDSAHLENALWYGDTATIEELKGARNKAIAVYSWDDERAERAGAHLRSKLENVVILPGLKDMTAQCADVQLEGDSPDSPLPFDKDDHERDEDDTHRGGKGPRGPKGDKKGPKKGGYDKKMDKKGHGKGGDKKGKDWDEKDGRKGVDGPHASEHHGDDKKMDKKGHGKGGDKKGKDCDKKDGRKGGDGPHASEHHGDDDHHHGRGKKALRIIIPSAIAAAVVAMLVGLYVYIRRRFRCVPVTDAENKPVVGYAPSVPCQSVYVPMQEFAPVEKPAKVVS